MFFQKIFLSVLEIADIATAVCFEGEIADRCNQSVDPERYDAEKEVRARSWLPSVGFHAGVVDDKAADKTQEKGEQKPCNFVTAAVVHK